MWTNKKSILVLVLSFLGGGVLTAFIAFVNRGMDFSFSQVPIDFFILPSLVGGLAAAVIAYFLLRNRILLLDRLEAEQRFRRSFEEAAIGMTMVDLDGRFRMVNDAFCRMVGYSLEELQAKSIADITHPDDIGTSLTTRRRLIADGAPGKSMEKKYVHKDGHIVWGSTSRAIVRDAAGTPLYTIGQIQDITKRKEIEEALRKSEKLYRTLVETSHDLIWSCDNEGKFSYVNQAVKASHGYRPEEVIGRPFTDFMTAEQAAKDHKVFAKILRGKACFGVETVHLRKNGAPVHLNFNAVAQRDDDGKIIGAMGTAQDITERVLAEDRIDQIHQELEQRVEQRTIELSESEQRLQAVIENTAEGIVTIGDTGLIESINPEAERLFGYTASEIVGENVSILIPPDGQNEHVKHLANSEMHAPRIINRSRDLFGLRKDGTVFSLELNVAPMDIKRQRKYVGILRDDSDRKRAEAELRAAKENAEVANQAKSEFLANMSHELRTPLNAIIGFGQLLSTDQMDLSEIKRQEYVDIIVKSGEYLSELINDILDFSAVEAGGVALQNDTIDLNKTFDRAIKLVKIENAELTIECSISDGLTGINGDDRRILQILINLLSNAVKFTPHGGKIELNARRGKDGSLLITVSDPGIGMDEKGIAKAMEKFGQIKQDNLTTTEEGTGLGLPLTKGLVEAHGGTMEIESELNIGTAVTVRLPEERVINQYQGAIGT